MMVYEVVVTEKVTSFIALHRRVWNPLAKCHKSGAWLFGRNAAIVYKTIKGGYPDEWGKDPGYTQKFYFTPGAYMISALHGEFNNSIEPEYTV